MATPRRARAHHLVPKSYLRLFGGGDVVTVQRRNGETYPSGINAVTVRNDFYSFIDNTGTVTSRLETWLDKGVESRGVPVLRALAEGRSTTDENRQDLVIFVAVQIIRTAGVAEIMTQIDRHLLPALVYQEVLSRHGASPGRLTVDQRREFMATMALLDRTAVDSRESQLRTMLRETVKLVDRLRHWYWHVVSAENPCLITGDSPVVTIQPPVGWHGLIPAGSPVFLPLTPSQLLIGEEQPPLRSEPLSTQLAAVVNQRICDEARDLIINRPNLPWPESITLLRKRPPLPAPTITFARAPDGSEPTSVVFPEGQESLDALLHIFEEGGLRKETSS